MTEEQSGGTTPEPEAVASAADRAPDDTAAAVAVADDPATITQDPADVAEHIIDAQENGAASAETATATPGERHRGIRDREPEPVRRPPESHRRHRRRARSGTRQWDRRADSRSSRRRVLRTGPGRGGAPAAERDEDAPAAQARPE